MKQRSIAVVGGGFSGTMLALNLLRTCPTSTRVLLIERRDRFGPGQAYATQNPNHLLNVRTGRMSPFEDHPLAFHEWLQRQADHAACHPDGFTSRQAFGTYLQHLLAAALSTDSRRLELIKAQVTAIAASPSLGLILDDGRAVAADAAVLAVGNFPPQPPGTAESGFYSDPLYCADPWAPDAIDLLDLDAHVMLIGSGLTMVDVVVSLLDAGHRGRIHALSRRGLLPQRHQDHSAHPDPGHVAVSACPRTLLRALREATRLQQTCGGDWRETIDALRPYTQNVWRDMSSADRTRFLRHLRPFWDVHRHRMAGTIAERIDAARTRGQLTVSAGRIQQIIRCGADAKVTYRPRGMSQCLSQRVARVINCTGPASDYHQIKDTLIRQLLRDGVVRCDPQRMGIDVTSGNAVIGRNGAVMPNLFAVGPVTKGVFWEMTAVPDIRRQCRVLADRLGGCSDGRHDGI